MRSLGRIGLQRRTFLYVAVGSAVMFGIFTYLGLKAIGHSTDLVFQERLTLAQELAAGLSRGFEHVAADAREDLDSVNGGTDVSTLEKAVRDAFHHLSEVDKFPLFKVSGLWLITRDNRVVAEPSVPLPYNRAWITSHFEKDLSLRVLSPTAREDKNFVYLLVPMVDRKQEIWSLALFSTAGFSGPRPFTPLKFLGLGDNESEPPNQSRYVLEIVSPRNVVLLSIGSQEPAGRLSSHLSVIEYLRETRGTNAGLHRMPGGSGESDHVVVSAPVPGSDLYLVLKQEEDVALALPHDLLRQLLLFGSAGFLVSLLVAWVTIRSVVKPAEALIRASERLARGELGTPVAVRAPDEIGLLAENLEAMRLRLNGALQDLEQANRELEARVNERTRRLSEALQKIISAQEEERVRLARELHDETAQALVMMGLLLDGIRNKAIDDPSATLQQALKAKELANDLLQSTRRLIFDLRPTVLDDFGLGAALRWYSEHHLEDRGIKVDFRADSPAVPDHIQVAIFRIAQEAINNIAKHSGARNARIQVSNLGHVISLLIEDDGRGFDPAKNRGSASSVGLVGMRERANLLGAKLEISSVPGQGARVYLEVPGES